MLAVSPELIHRYEARLVQQNLTAGQRPHYHKWLRYYLDFCQKYGLVPADRQSLPAFQEKLRAKCQPEPLCQQAGHAISHIGRWFFNPSPSHALRTVLLPHRVLPRLEMCLVPWRRSTQAHSRRSNPSALPRHPPYRPRNPPRAKQPSRHLRVHPPPRNCYTDRKE